MRCIDDVGRRAGTRLWRLLGPREHDLYGLRRHVSERDQHHVGHRSPLRRACILVTLSDTHHEACVHFGVGRRHTGIISEHMIVLRQPITIAHTTPASATAACMQRPRMQAANNTHNTTPIHIPQLSLRLSVWTFASLPIALGVKSKWPVHFDRPTLWLVGFALSSHGWRLLFLSCRRSSALGMYGHSMSGVSGCAGL